MAELIGGDCSSSQMSAEERWQQAAQRRQGRVLTTQKGSQEEPTHFLSNLAVWVYIVGAAVLIVGAMHMVRLTSKNHGEGGGDVEEIPRQRVGFAPIQRDGSGQDETRTRKSWKARQEATPADASSFVRVRNGKFEVNCRPFYIAGFNAHDLIEISMLDAKSFSMESKKWGVPDDVSGHLRVRATLREASTAGLNVVRIWGFTNYKKFPFQEKPGKYNKDALEALDYVLTEARQFGIRVIIAFTDNWRYLNGADQYLDWSETAPQRVQKRPKSNLEEPMGFDESSGYESSRHSLFFSDPGAKALYKNHVKAIVNRRNQIHGRAYKDDPTIFAWELINEPRCNSADNPDCTRIVQEWVEEMSAHVKKLDQNHLVSIGAEGFFSSGGESDIANPGSWAEAVGQDFIKNHSPDSIDFGAIHAWPDSWNRPDLEFQSNWIKTHAQVSTNVLEKPLILEEFGKKLPHDAQDSESDIGQTRDPLYARTLELVANEIVNHKSVGGALFWRLHLSTYEGRGRGRYGVKPSDSTFSYVKEFASIVHTVTHSQPPMPKCDLECWVPYEEDSRNFCVQDSNACKIYWDFQDGKGNYNGRNSSQVLVPVWDQEIPLSEMMFFTSWLECCRKGVGAFKEGCNLEYGFSLW